MASGNRFIKFTRDDLVTSLRTNALAYIETGKNKINSNLSNEENNRDERCSELCYGCELLLKALYILNYAEEIADTIFAARIKPDGVSQYTLIDDILKENKTDATDMSSLNSTAQLERLTRWIVDNLVKGNAKTNGLTKHKTDGFLIFNIGGGTKTTFDFPREHITTGISYDGGEHDLRYILDRLPKELQNLIIYKSSLSHLSDNYRRLSGDNLLGILDSINVDNYFNPLNAKTASFFFSYRYPGVRVKSTDEDLDRLKCLSKGLLSIINYYKDYSGIDELPDFLDSDETYSNILMSLSLNSNIKRILKNNIDIGNLKVIIQSFYLNGNNGIYNGVNFEEFILYYDYFDLEKFYKNDLDDDDILTLVNYFSTFKNSSNNIDTLDDVEMQYSLAKTSINPGIIPVIRNIDCDFLNLSNEEQSMIQKCNNAHIVYKRYYSRYKKEISEIIKYNLYKENEAIPFEVLRDFNTYTYIDYFILYLKGKDEFAYKIFTKEVLKAILPVDYKSVKNLKDYIDCLLSLVSVINSNNIQFLKDADSNLALIKEYITHNAKELRKLWNVDNPSECLSSTNVLRGFKDFALQYVQEIDDDDRDIEYSIYVDYEECEDYLAKLLRHYEYFNNSMAINDLLESIASNKYANTLIQIAIYLVKLDPYKEYLEIYSYSDFYEILLNIKSPIEYLSLLRNLSDSEEINVDDLLYTSFFSDKMPYESESALTKMLLKAKDCNYCSDLSDIIGEMYALNIKDINFITDFVLNILNVTKPNDALIMYIEDLINLYSSDNTKNFPDLDNIKITNCVNEKHLEILISLLNSSRPKEDVTKIINLLFNTNDPDTIYQMYTKLETLGDMQILDAYYKAIMNPELTNDSIIKFIDYVFKVVNDQKLRKRMILSIASSYMNEERLEGFIYAVTVVNCCNAISDQTTKNNFYKILLNNTNKESCVINIWKYSEFESLDDYVAYSKFCSQFGDYISTDCYKAIMKIKDSERNKLSIAALVQKITYLESIGFVPYIKKQDGTVALPSSFSALYYISLDEVKEIATIIPKEKYKPISLDYFYFSSNLSYSEINARRTLINAVYGEYYGNTEKPFVNRSSIFEIFNIILNFNIDIKEYNYQFLCVYNSNLILLAFQIFTKHWDVLNQNFEKILDYLKEKTANNKKLTIDTVTDLLNELGIEDDVNDLDQIMFLFNKNPNDIRRISMYVPTNSTTYAYQKKYGKNYGYIENMNKNNESFIEKYDDIINKKKKF